MKGSEFVPLNMALPILRQVALALDYAHEKGIVHGDIKPENVLFLKDSSHAYLSDFGISKHFSRDERTTAPIPHDEGGGTVAYMSPEHLTQSRRSPASDIYSFTTMAYEMVAGHLPFRDAESFYALIQSKLEGKMISADALNPKLTKPISAILMKGLSTAPENRPSSALQLCAMLAHPEDIKPEPVKHVAIFHRFGSLEPAQKTAIIVALIGALGGTVAAVLKAVPELWNK